MLEDIVNERIKKLRRMRDAGVDPYPAGVSRTHDIREVLDAFDALADSGERLCVCGRVMSVRDQGKLLFIDVKDGTARIQAVVKRNSFTGDFAFFKDIVDNGDFVSVSGAPFRTKRGEESIEAAEAHILSKSIRPVPSEWYGVSDEETRLRKRYLEILLNDEIRDLFRKKEAFWQAMRDFLKEEGFMEVETPVLQPIAGGADAEPFATHHNALDTDFYLRIALELPLKKLLVAGYEKVFEIGRIFRNEGISREHLQDYTQMEFYWAYHDYNDLMDMVERMYKRVVEETTGGLQTEWNGKTIDWSGQWPRIDYVEVFEKEHGCNPLESDRKTLLQKSNELGLRPEENLGKGKLIDLIFKKTIRPTLVQPAFLVNPPVELVPLAKRCKDDPRKVERMQPVACGTELGNGFSELNDPLDQRERFEEQMELREAGDAEAQELDEDYLGAMEYGMPPATGFGVSERFFAVLMDRPVRETVIFPLMRPKDHEA